MSAEEERLYGDLEDLRQLSSGLEMTIESLRQQALAVTLSSRPSDQPQLSSPFARLLISPEKSPIKQVEWFNRRRIVQPSSNEKSSLLLTTPKKSLAKVANETEGLTKEEIDRIRKQLSSQVFQIQ